MRRAHIIGFAAFLVSLAVGWPVTAQPSGGYDLSWWTVDGGGVVGVGQPGLYSPNGTIGQPDARVWGDGGYLLVGGFWYGRLGSAEPYHIYLPVLLRGQ